MSGRRRREIVRIARRHDAIIIEDDVYALGRDRTAPALTDLAPERTYYVTSASKALSPAVRVGALRPPAACRDRAVQAVRALAQPVSPIQCDLLAELTRTGIAGEVRTAIRREGARRSALARAVLGPSLRTADHGGYHAFLPLPRSLADAAVLAAAAGGVELTGPASLMADPASPRGGIRLCLGGPSWNDLSRGLAAVLVESPGPRQAGQVVTGRVTGADGKPVSGIKVWLNAWPNAARARELAGEGRPVPITVVGSATTSATGKYAIRVTAPAALARNATNGVVRFSVETGAGRTLGLVSFSGRLAQTTAGATVTLPSGTTNLRLSQQR